jgi:hypothetical protein
MKRLLATVAFSALVLGSAASSGSAGDLTTSRTQAQAASSYNQSMGIDGSTRRSATLSTRSYESTDQWRQDHSADELNAESLTRAMPTMTYGASDMSPQSYGSGMSDTTTTTTVVTPRGVYRR